MTIVEKLSEKAQALPPDLQMEALRYVDYLTRRPSEDDLAWSRFSLETALRGMEVESWPEYQVSDYLEKWR